MPDTKSSPRCIRPVPLRMTETLITKVEDAAKATSLSKQDVMRLSIERGIDVLLSQLQAKAS